MNSKPFRLNATDLPALLKACGVGVGIASLTFLSEFVTQVDFGDWTALVVGVVAPVLTAAIRFLKNNDAQ